MSDVEYRLHALQQMTERKISRADVLRVIGQNDVVETSHHRGRAMPTRLLVGWSRGRALHVVIADAPDGTQYVVTAYEPSRLQWHADLRTRKGPL